MLNMIKKFLGRDLQITRRLTEFLEGDCGLVLILGLVVWALVPFFENIVKSLQ
jgi:hypothetical protein